MPRKKSKKHPMEMTDEEALKHLFHPKIVKAVKGHLETETEQLIERAERAKAESKMLREDTERMRQKVRKSLSRRKA